MRKSYLYFAIFLLPLSSPLFCMGSHHMGAEITYECVSNCTIRVHLRAYRDCYGLTTINSNISFLPVSGTNCNNNSTPPSPISNWSPIVISDITPACPGQSLCSNINGQHGVQEYHWYRDYDICIADTSCEWGIFWTGCCRSPIITSGVSGPLLSWQTLPIPNPSSNNSPIFNQEPLVAICLGTPLQIDQGAFDPDGDSLVYYLGMCYNGFSNNSFTPATYGTGYSPTSPLGADWDFSLDSATGLLTILPTPGSTQIGTVCFYVDEYRNGTLLGTTFREIQVRALNCGPINPPSISSISNVSGNAYSMGDTLFACGSFCFDLYATDLDSTDTITFSWDQSLLGATFADTGNPSLQDTLIGQSANARFCFAPPASGTYHFRVKAKDSQCPWTLTTDKYLTIIATQNPGFSINVSPGFCQSANFVASSCGTGNPYSYQWTGAGGLNGMGQSISHIYPFGGTFSWQVIVSNLLGPIDTVWGSVIISNSPPQYQQIIITLGPVSICNNQSATLYGAWGLASYSWSNGGTAQSLTTSSPGTYYLFGSDSSGCQYIDSIEVVLDTSRNYLPLISGLTNQLKLCDPQPILLMGEAGYSTYNWFSNGNSLDTNQNYSTSIPGLYYLEVTDANGCLGYDSVYVTYDSLGYLQGIIKSPWGNPLINQKVYLITYDSVLVKLNFVDSTLTNSAGKYEFCFVQESVFYIKVEPDSSSYPTSLPTYADTTLFWNFAKPFLLSNTPIVHDFMARYGYNQGGPGLYAGTVEAGIFHMLSFGDSVPGINIFIIDSANGDVLDHEKTDANGLYYFPMVNIGHYYIKADYPLVTTKNDSVPNLVMGINNLINKDICLELNNKYLALCSNTTNHEMVQTNTVSVYPNPSAGSYEIEIKGEPNLIQKLLIFDVHGQVIEDLPVDLPVQNKLHIDIGEEYGAGIYFLKFIGEKTIVKKLVKM
ncbi:MAG: T9SS type A sorting domain-containing protein [Bacteroidia bacterium]|nr:T9SS type A sorting domain-containing protein [Bacteroidia bacterium]